MKPMDITDKNFEEQVLQEKMPVLVDFWAPWCGPCRMMAPVLEKLAEKYKDKVHIKKMNVDDNPLFASKYNIRSIPTIIVFKDGKPVSTQIGFVPAETLTKELDAVI